MFETVFFAIVAVVAGAARRLSVCRWWPAIGVALAFLVVQQASGFEVEELCARRFDRMAANQTGRLIEEVMRLSRREPVDFAKSALVTVDEDGNLVAPNDLGKRKLAHGLTRVEKHGDNKFPRKCTGVRPDFFEPACSNIVDSGAQLRRCLYNEHTLPLLRDLVAIVAELEVRCRTATLKQARLAWNDWIQEDDERAFERRLKRVVRRCADSSHWATVIDVVKVCSEKIRDVVP